MPVIFLNKSLKRLVLAAAFASIALLAFHGQGAAQDEAPGEPTNASPPPIIRFDQNEFHAGEAKPGTTISHDFAIYNDGESDLIIHDVVPGCGCSVATFPKTLAPGEKGVITLMVDLYSEWAGREVNKMAVVLSNDPAAPHTKITMRAKVLSN